MSPKTDKNQDGRIQYYNDRNPAFAERAAAQGWNGNELHIDRDIIVLANPEIARLPAQVVAFAFGLAASSFFPVIVPGIFSKRMNHLGAIAGMISRMSFTSAYIIYFKFISPEANTAAHWLWSLSLRKGKVRCVTSEQNTSG